MVLLSQKDKYRLSGFTLIELLLVITIISTIGLMATPIAASTINRSQRITTSSNLTSALRRAYVNSRTMLADSSWGVRIQSNEIIIFEGDSYATRNTGSDIISTFSNTLQITNSNELVFSKFTGLPSNTNSFIITSSDGSQTTIEINTNGNINYQ